MSELPEADVVGLSAYIKEGSYLWLAVRKMGEAFEATVESAAEK